MSSVLIHPANNGIEYADCARLIPGESAASSVKEKEHPKSARPFVFDTTETRAASVVTSAPSLLDLLVPHPLGTRIAPECLLSICTDFALIVLSWLSLGGALRILHPIFAVVPFFEGGLRSCVFLLGISFLHASLITLLGYVDGLYRTGTVRAQTRAAGKAVMWGSLILCFGYLLQGSRWSVVGLICSIGIVNFALMWFWRRSSTETESVEGVTTRNVLIVGAGRVGRRVAAYIEAHPGCGRKMCGFLDDQEPLGSDVIGRIADLAFMARKEFVEELILAGPQDGALAQRLFHQARRLRLDFEVVPELFGCDPADEEVETIAGLPVICIHAERLPAASLVIKRIMDVIGASFGLVLLSPALLATALLIKLDSAGPVLYVAKRVGRKGRLFRCYKFRSMVSDADQRKEALRTKNERSGPIFKIFEDPRITRVGRFLRRYSLDELPQLWNVVRGEMSLVGPRPHPVDEFAGYDLGHLARLDVTPGLTGLWQVLARRDPSFDRSMQLDREYIRNWSLWLDIMILLRTVLAVARGSGN